MAAFRYRKSLVEVPLDRQGRVQPRGHPHVIVPVTRREWSLRWRQRRYVLAFWKDERAVLPEAFRPQPAREPMGPSGYRRKFGTSDGDMIAAVRAHYSGDPSFTMTDAEIVDAIGWAYTARTAIAKVQAVRVFETAGMDCS